MTIQKTIHTAPLSAFLCRTFLLIFALFISLPTSLDAKKKHKKKNVQKTAVVSKQVAKPVAKQVIKKVEPIAPEPMPSVVETPVIKMLHVLLEEHSIESNPHLIVQGKQGFILSSPAELPEGILFDVDEMHILCANNRLYLQCKDGKHRRLKHNSLEISNPHQKLTVSGKTYQGSIIIRIDRDHKKVLVINKVSLEDYVYAVVRCECIPTWPLEMQKLQAIISRSYAAYQMTLARSAKPLYQYYDIRNTNIHQVYNGSHTSAHIRQAVEETQDLVLSYNNKIALTMFDICCGGSIPSLMRCKDTSKPYLMRNKKCTYCTASKHYTWKVDVSKSALLKKLQELSSAKESCKGLKSIQKIAVVDADRAGIVHKVAITGNNNKRILLSGRDIKRALNPQIHSLNFTIKLIGDRVVIHGHGHGHQKGVCQFGCKELLARGWSLQRVLQFYYPGAMLSRLA